MKVLFVLEAGLPEYRDFLFEKLNKEAWVSELLILHNGRLYNGGGMYKSIKLKYIGTDQGGFQIGVLSYIFKYDIVISSYNLRNLSCWLPCFLKKKWIFWGKGLGSNDGFIVNTLRTLTAKKASALLVYNEFKKKELIQLTKVSKEKVFAYNNTIPVSHPEMLGHKPKTHFLYFGRLQERKGLVDLIKEYKNYLLKNDHGKIFKLRFVGNGNDVHKLKELVKELGLETMVEFYPGVYDDKSIKEHFAHAVAYVSPYNVGLGVVNSFSYGVPVITCKTPQVGPEFHYLNDKNAFIVEDITNFKEAMVKISQLYDSEDILPIFNYCYTYYSKNLSTTYMYNSFVKAIKKVYNE